MREKALSICLVVVLGLFLVFFVVSDRNYNDLLNTNDALLSQMEESRSKYDEIINQWQTSYDELQTEYGAKIVECEQLKENRTIIPKVDFTPAEIQLLAECVQCEAGVGNETSQKYVCSVILNRLVSAEFPNTIEEVIYQKVGGVPQFSVAYNGSMDECELSDEVLLNTYRTITYRSYLPEYVLYFYSEEVDENWVNSLNTYTIEEGTVFAYE